MNDIKTKVYTRYPLLYVLIYNVTTIFHFLLGGIGIILGYHSWIGNVLGTLYILFAFIQMYVIMPSSVCPNCVYYKMDNSLCASGMNLVSRKIAREGDLKDFSKRSEGLFCHNNLYMSALFLPILVIIPALIMDFSFIVLGILLSVIGLLLFRFFVIFRKTACIHCAAKKDCPNAQAMGLDKLA
jgi:hypothetical protein